MPAATACFPPGVGAGLCSVDAPLQGDIPHALLDWQVRRPEHSPGDRAPAGPDQDLVGRLGPGERMGAVVPAIDVGAQLGVEVLDRGVGAAVDRLAFCNGEPALDHVHPRGVGWGEVHPDPWVLGQPRLDPGVLVSGVVVHHQVQFNIGVGARPA